jgi:hypothetical protein
MENRQADLTAQLKELVALLNKIERTYASERSKAIGQLQNKIWDEPALQTEELYFLQDLAGDLNFYEPVERDRDLALGYYDDNRLLELTGAALKRLSPFLLRDNFLNIGNTSHTCSNKKGFRRINTDY